MSWTKQSVADIGILKSSLGGPLDEVQLPHTCVNSVWDLMREFPPQWMSIAAKYSTPFDDAALGLSIVFPSAGPA